MSITRTILKPLAFAAGLHAGKQMRRFLKAHRQTQQVQDAFLNELISRHCQTAFGRDHDFARLRSYDDFKAVVPVGNYETLRPYMQRVYEGDYSALIPSDDRVVMFSMTSGTTGTTKYIPVTNRFLKHMQRGSNIFGMRAMNDHPDGWLRDILQIASPMHQVDSPTGLPCGAISGLLTSRQMWIARRMQVVRAGVSSIPESESRYYTTLRCGVGRDVGIIVTANPSSTIKLIETAQEHTERLIRDISDGTINPPGGLGADLAASLRFKPNPALSRRMEEGIKRDGQLLPRHFWSIAFMTNWMGGTLKLYLPRLKELFGNVPIRDIGLLASEGRFSVPIEDHTPVGLAEITGNFLEFIPAEQQGDANPTTLRAHEVEVAQEYFLVVSNWAGLWRYNMDDRVRITGRYGESPLFEFLSRGLHTASITGEKITEYQVVEAMRLASNSEGTCVERFVLQGRFARPPYYELRMECGDEHSATRLAERMDASLCELNMEYQSKRKSGRLGPIRLEPLPVGAIERTEAELIARRGGKNEQYKHQYLLSEVLSEQSEDQKTLP